MKIKETRNQIEVITNKLTISYQKKSDYFKIIFSTFEQYFFIPSSCDTISGFDLNHKQKKFTYIENKNYIKLLFYYDSTLWEKIYMIEIYNDYIEYSYKLLGEGKVTEMHFFEGIWEKNFEEDFYLTKHFNDNKKTPYQEYSTKSPINFQYVFNPEPNSYNKQNLNAYEYGLIGINSDLDYCGGNFIANPGIFTYLISNNQEEWITLGLSVPIKENTFSEFEYFGGKEFGLNLNYWGLLNIKESYETPKIIISSNQSINQSINQYITIIRNKNNVPKIKNKQIYNWWKAPILCGWGYQSYIGDLFRVRTNKPKDTAVYDACTEKNYIEFIQDIDNFKLPWGTLIIDAKWFIEDALLTPDLEKWPNIRNFVDKLHKRDKKVLIWWGPWSTGGFDKNEVITYKNPDNKRLFNREGKFAKFGGKKNGDYLAPDISIENVKEKIRKKLHYLLSSDEDCLNLDGIKIDHIASVPSFYSLEYPPYSKKIAGTEFIKLYYDLIYETTKNIKKDALIIGQSPNPYFSDSFDMLRLGDIYSKKKNSVVSEMKFRKDMAILSNPNWLIDCDGWPLPSIEAAAEYLLYQTKLGVPSLYYTNFLDTTKDIIPSEYMDKLSYIWKEYRKNNE